jgi:hypothetical protein
VDDVDLDVLHVHELPVEGDPLHRQQAARDVDRLAHRLYVPAAMDADLGRERVPPRPEAELDPPGSEVVECRERRGEQPDVPRPGVHHARADSDPLRHGGKGRHRHGGLANEPALRLPDGLEAALVGELRVPHAVPDRMLVLQVERYAVTNVDGHRRPPFGSNGCGPISSRRFQSRSA